MKKYLLATTIVAGFIAASAFADGLGDSSVLGGSAASTTLATPLVVAKRQPSSKTDACVLDLIGNTLTTLVQDGLKKNRVTFESDSNVKQTLQNLQNETCSHTSGITITSKDGLVVVSRTSPGNNYVYYAWYKSGYAVCAKLNSNFQIE
jgi:hypothetical protein